MAEAIPSKKLTGWARVQKILAASFSNLGPLGAQESYSPRRILRGVETEGGRNEHWRFALAFCRLAALFQHPHKNCQVKAIFHYVHGSRFPWATEMWAF